MHPAASTFSDGATSDDLGGDYDVISDAGGAGPPSESLDSSIADLDRDVERDLEYAMNYGVTSVIGLGERDEHRPGSGHGAGHWNVEVREPKPSRDAGLLFELAGVGPEDVQAYVKRNSDKGSGGGTASAAGTLRRGTGGSERTVRVYVDGVFDLLHVGTMLRLRQAKLSFPSVHLIVGVFSDDQIRIHSSLSSLVPHAERCELVRHVRWVDEVLPFAPFSIDEVFLARNKIDYVAIEEGSSVDPKVEKVRVGGYDLAKTLGKAIPTRRTRNVVAQSLTLTSFQLPQVTPSPPDFTSRTTQARTPKPSTVGEALPSLPSHPISRPRPASVPRSSATVPSPPPVTGAQGTSTQKTEHQSVKDAENREAEQARKELAESERERLLKQKEAEELEERSKETAKEEEETPEPKDVFGLGI